MASFIEEMAPMFSWWSLVWFITVVVLFIPIIVTHILTRDSYEHED